MADRNITVALTTAGLLLSPTAFMGKRVTALEGAPSPTFKQIRRLITSLFPMLAGPLQIEAVGNGAHTNREDLIRIDTRLPPGDGSVRAFIQRYRAQCTLQVAPLSNTGTIDSKAPLILMSMKIRRPPCSHTAEAQ